MIKMTRWFAVLILVVACAAATPPALPPTSTPTATPVAPVVLPGPTVPGANAPTVTPPSLAPTSLPAASPAEWAGRNRGDPNAFSKPTGLALDPQGNLYVVDGRNARIQKFDPDGRFLTSWGSGGIGDGEFHFLEGVLATPCIRSYLSGTLAVLSAAGTTESVWGDWLIHSRPV